MALILWHVTKLGEVILVHCGTQNSSKLEGVVLESNSLHSNNYYYYKKSLFFSHVDQPCFSHLYFKLTAAQVLHQDPVLLFVMFGPC